VTSPAKAFEEGVERQLDAQAGSRLVPLLSAIVAVLAAFGSLFAHHKSIEALALKNQAIRDTLKASDQYGYYQAKRTRINIDRALLDAGLARDAQARARLTSAIDREEIASLATLADARAQDTAATAMQDRSQILLQSFQTFEIATTLFEISIVLISISAITRAPALLWTSTVMSALGVGLFILAYIQGH
jgi:hypothetical protein